MTCTLHDVVEYGVYPYRCSRCGECYVCQHTRGANYANWICPDGRSVPIHVDPGVLAPESVKKF